MQVFRTITAALLLAAAQPLVASAQAVATNPDTAKVDVTGAWAFTVQSDAGSGTPTVTFVQKGDSISGRYASQALGNRDFAGTLKAGKITFGFTAESGGQTFSMSFAGALTDRDSMSGSIDFAGMGTGTFSGKRAKR